MVSAFLGRVFGFLGRWLFRIGLLTLITWIIALLFGGDSNVVFVLFAAAAPWMPIGAALVALLAMSQRKKFWALLSAIATITSALLWLPPQATPQGVPTAASKSGANLKLLELNTLIGVADPIDLMNSIQNNQIDIAVLVETNDFGEHRWRSKKIHGYFQYKVRGVSTFEGNDSRPAGTWGQDIWSKTELTNLRQVPGTLYKTIAVDTVINGKALTVVVFHSDNPTTNISRWQADLRALAKFVKANSGKPLVVAGDFNGTSRMAVFDEIKTAGVRDSADFAGWSWQQNTWPTHIRFNVVSPLIRTDHILVSNLVGVKAVHTERIGETDHAAVIAELFVN